MQKLTKETLKIYWQHAARYPWAMGGVAFFVVAATALELYSPFLYKRLFDLLASGPNQPIEPLFDIVWLILLVGVIHHLTWRVIMWINNFFQPRVMSDLLNTAYEYLHGHSYNFFSNNFVGSLVTKVRRYQKSFEDVADKAYFELGRTLLIAFSICVVLFFRHWAIGLMILVWAAIYIGSSYYFSQFKLKYDLQRADQDTKTTAHLADTVTNNLNVKLFATLASEVSAFRKITDELYRIRKFTWDLSNYIEIVQGFLMVLLEFAVIYVGVRFWQQGILSVGDFALLQAYLIHMFNHLWDIGRHIRSLYESLADANEMTQILIEPHAVTDKNKKQLRVPAGKIEFSKVGFGYEGQQPIFQDFSLVIKPGERLALVGSSGGGKSTIVKLLFRFYDIQQGQINVDGQDIARVTQESLRSNIALVPQEPILFHRSLMDNIRYGRPEATEEEVIAAAKLAHCHEFISSFPQQYETLVGERGVKLSGGERQRVAIARAILKNAPILVLDEATSSLDSESEFLIQDALKVLMRGKTTIVIAHRLSTIMQMDRIIVLDHGRIMEEGRHEELVKAKSGTYQKLWQIQAGGFAG